LTSLLAGAASSLLAGSFGYVDLPAGTAVTIVPATGVSAAPAWATNVAYTSGAKALTGSGVYTAIDPGTSAATATVFSAATVVDNGVIWYRNMTRARKGLSLTISGTGDVYLSFAEGVGNGKGTLLAAGGGPYVLSYVGETVWQGSVTCYSTNTFSVYGQEW